MKIDVNNETQEITKNTVISLNTLAFATITKYYYIHECVSIDICQQMHIHTHTHTKGWETNNECKYTRFNTNVPCKNY